MITTKKSFAFTYGYVRLSPRFPVGPEHGRHFGSSQTSTWPPEIDIMENFAEPVFISARPTTAGERRPHAETGGNETTSAN